MPRGERGTHSGESPQERVAAAVKVLEQGIDSILSSESFAAYLTTMSRFHNYSFGNIALIYTQLPTASRVAGFHKWRELGRQVKAGEKGIKILVPHKHRIKPEDGEEKEETIVLRGFGVGTVFDISQTEGKDLAEPPLVEHLQESSDAGAALYGYLEQYLSGRGVPVIRTNTKPSNGYFDPIRRVVAIDEELAGDQATKTLAHETGHVVAGHSYGMNNRDVETVGESAAFVVLNHFGIDASGYSFPYVARWAQDRQVLKRNLEAIQQTAHQIIEGLEEMELPVGQVQEPPIHAEMVYDQRALL